MLLTSFDIGFAPNPCPRKLGAPQETHQRTGPLREFEPEEQLRFAAERPDRSRALRRIWRAFRGRRHDLVREADAGNPHVRFDERRLESESWRGVRHRPRAKAHRERLPPSAYRHRASRGLCKAPGSASEAPSPRSIVRHGNAFWVTNLGRPPAYDEPAVLTPRVPVQEQAVRPD